MAAQTPFGSAFVIPLLLASALCAGLALYVRLRLRATGARATTLLLVACAVWALAYALMQTSSELPAKLLWHKMVFAGIVLIPPSWLGLALQCTGRGGWLEPARIAALTVVPTLTLLLVVTNESHALVWTAIALDPADPFLPVVFTPGPAFWLHATYAYALLVVGAYLFAEALVRARPLYRWHATVLLVALFVPALTQLLYLVGRSPFGRLDPTPLALGGSGMALVLGLGRLRPRDIAGVSRRVVVDSMQDGVLVLDDQGRVLDQNPAAQRILGLTAAAVGLSLPDLGLERLGAVLPATNPRVLSALSLGKDDRQRFYEVSVSPIRDWRGSLAIQVVVLRDVTERKRVERLQREFIDLAAHELRTPLTTLKGYTQILSRWGGHNPNEEAIFRTLAAQEDRMARLIERVEQVSQLRADDLSSRQQRLDLGDLAREVVARLPSVRSSPPILVTTAGPTPVDGDERWLGVALRNLLDNATKIGPPDKPIEVKVEARGIEGVISVRDQGPGIPPERQPQLFDAFYQLAPMVHPTTGLGLGLYISSEVIRQHGGRIWVESEVGKGSTFAFALPLQGLQSAAVGSVQSFQ